MEKYLEELAQKYKGNYSNGSVLLSLLLVVNLIATVLTSSWIYKVDMEQQRRSDAITKVRKSMID